METVAGEGFRIKGKVKINAYRDGMVAAAKPYLDQIRFLQSLTPNKILRGEIAQLRQALLAIKMDFFIRTACDCPNLVMDSPNCGLDLVIQRLVGINTYSLNIGWIEIGTGSATPNVNDVALTTPSVRSAIDFQEDYGTTDAIVQTYITDANLPNATYSEVGSFVDGTASIGSGQIFNHALLSPVYSKVAGQDTTIQIDYTLTNSS